MERVPTVPNQEKKKPSRFNTAQGSVYEYLPDGRTQRFKTAINEQQEPNDAIVFVPPWDLVKNEVKKNYPKIFEQIEGQGLFEALLLDYVKVPGHTMRITDGQGKELLSNGEIKAADKVFILCLDKKDLANSFYIPVSKEPKIGFQTYDTSKYVGEDGQTYRDKHLGNAVTEIEYAEK